MVRVEFPMSLLEPAFLGCLIREKAEDFITKARVAAAQNSDRYQHLFSTGAYGLYANGAKGEKIQEFFGALGLEERETLNGVAVAGSCQFSCLADQLFGRECTADWRADVFLRELALFVIATNEDQFRCFMLHANPKTRSQNKTAGESVDLESYIRKMQKSSTDGDHLTLQALCDALQCPIHVLQVVDAPMADKIIAQSEFKNVVINELHPRLLPHLHKFMPRLQVQRRELWLTLHGEAHFKSLHCTSYTEQEASAALAELQLLQTVMPDPPPTPTSAITSANGSATPEPTTETCSICLEDLDMERRGVSAGGAGPMVGSGAIAATGSSAATSSTTATVTTTSTCTRTPPPPPLPPASPSSSGPSGGAGKKPLFSDGVGRARQLGPEVPAKPDVCMHTFHFGCLCDWAQISNVCPLCKARFQAIERLWGGRRTLVLQGRRGAPNRLTQGGGGRPPSSSGPTSEADEDRDEDRDDPDDPIRCYICSRANNSAVMLLCDNFPNCPNSAHTWCLGLDSVPNGDWFCPGCQRERMSGSSSTSSRASSDAEEPPSIRPSRPDRAERARRRSAQAEALEEERRRRREEARALDTRHNPVAREIQANHAAELPSTQPWARVLASAHRAEERTRSGVGVGVGSANGSRPAPPPAEVSGGSRDEAAHLFAEAQVALRAAQQGPPRSLSLSSERARSVYEISSDSEDSQPASSAAPVGSASAVNGDSASADAAGSASASAPANRPHKRPRAGPPPAILTARSSSPISHSHAHPSSKDPRALLARLEAAVDADVAAVESGWPPNEMARLTGDLNAIFSWDQRDQAKLLNLGLLKVLRRFLDPIPGRPSFLPQHSKGVILRLLQALPIGMAHLRESGLNRVLLSMCTQPGEERSVRDLVQSLIVNWARFVCNVKANGASTGISKGRWHSRHSPRSPPTYRPSSSSSSIGLGSSSSSGSAGNGGVSVGGGGGYVGPEPSPSSAFLGPYVPVTEPTRLFGNAQSEPVFALPTFRM